MKFVTVRDLRNKPAQIRKYLVWGKDIILTSNGKPFAIVTSTSEDTLENSLDLIRRIRAENAVVSMQKHSLQTGGNRITLEEINKEIAAVRKSHK